MKLLNNIYNKLRDNQKEIIDKCLKIKSGGLNLSMGYGKTIISLYISLILSKKEEKILIICSKTLIYTWINEIDKFFGKEIKYIILHKDYIKKINEFKLDDNIKIIITTPEVTSKYYKKLNIENKFVYYTIENTIFDSYSLCNYRKIDEPYSDSNEEFDILYSIKWGVLIVDEVQNYTNILTRKCRSIISICANYRWCLSGTLFSEPKIERILGYYLLINHNTFPRNLIEAKNLVIKDKESKYKGINETLITSDKIILDIKVNEKILINKLREEEEKIYIYMKSILKTIQSNVINYKAIGDIDNFRKFNAFKLSLLTYLRQFLVNPLLPLANTYLNISNLKEKNELAEIIMKNFSDFNIKNYLENEDNIISSRLELILFNINKNKDKKIIIFTCYRDNLDLLKYLIENKLNIETLSINSNMNINKRNNILEKFKKDNNILLLTYKLGSEGLNLQCADIVMLLDFEWSSNQTNQAIARVVRSGQIKKEIDIYYYISNLAIEKALFQKQKEKLLMLEELKTGVIFMKLKKIKVNDIINLITSEENIEQFYNVKNFKV